MPHAWYIYKGSGSSHTPANYSLFVPSPGVPVPTCCNGANLCAIYSLNGGPTPSSITPNIQAYLARAFAQQTCQPDTPAGAAKYVRMHP